MDEFNAGTVTLHEIQTEALLEDILKLNCRTTYNGDYNAVETLIDLNTAIKSADLTDRQFKLIRMIYIDGYKENEAAEALGIAKSTASYHKTRAVNKIAKVYENWEELDA